MKVLNLYAGIGGNRKLWQNVEVTAVELNPAIAKIYQDFFPVDTVIVADAHQYLLDHFDEFDFIWDSPPCQSHSRARFWSSKGGLIKPIYPDIKLYQEILFLKHYFNGLWVVENVIGFYKPLIAPVEIGRHYFWSNFHIKKVSIKKSDINAGTIESWTKEIGLSLAGKEVGQRKDQIFRNCVEPELGLHILNESKKNIQSEMFG